MSMTLQERDAAERRLDEIKAQIKALLASDEPTVERVPKWERLLTESLYLQERLDEDEPGERPG